MSKFLTRKKDGRVFPTDSRSGGTEYRKDYSESFEANKSNPKPTFSTKSNTSQDVRKITDSATDRDSKTYDSKTSRKNYKRYRANTKKKMDGQFKKSDKRARKKQHRAEKKRNKQQMKIEKSEIDKQIKYTEQKAKTEYVADQKDEEADRELAAKIDGRDLG